MLEVAYEIDRSKLPFRKNCEGYFVDKGRNVLARDTGNGFVEFPGGGIDDNENVENAILREAFEETGVIIKNLRKLGELKFIWGPNWAKTEKQKKRYLNYQGEDMHFFFGEIEKFIEPEEKQEDFWHGEKLVSISRAIEIIDSKRPFDDDVREYRELQLKFLRELQK